MAEKTPGQSLELFFIDGKPDGMLTAEVFGWTGHVLMTPRTQISEALSRKEARHTGVYLLFGELDGLPLAYIGESEDIGERIKSHDAKKDWWTRAILITTSANNLNKAHIKYLEARLVEEALSAGKIKLENGNTPSRASLTEAAISNMEAFLEKIFVVLPALRVDVFLKNTRPSKPLEPKTESGVEFPTFELSTPKHNIAATAKLENGEFVVQAGSKARLAWEGTPTHNYAKLFDELVREGVLIVDGDHRRFSANYAFNSPSAAGAVLNGRATNGQEAWKLRGSNKTYRQWEEERLKSLPLEEIGL
jgi:hypothetical protein